MFVDVQKPFKILTIVIESLNSSTDSLSNNQNVDTASCCPTGEQREESEYENEHDGYLYASISLREKRTVE